MKRTVALLLILVTLLTLFSGCSSQNQPTEPPEEPEKVKLWYAYNTENFMRDMQYPEQMESRDSTLRMLGIKGDVESVQLMITPTVDVKAYELTAGDLVSEEGHKIKKSNVDIFAEHYVEVNETYNTKSYYGYYPDALVPMKAYRRAKHNTIKAGENQGIWINVSIPVDAQSGFYTGVFTLTLDEETYEVPVQLTVYDITMPEEVHPKSCFLIWYDFIPYGEGTYSTELATRYFDFLVEKRTMPMFPCPAIENNYGEYIKWVVEAAQNPKISSYALPKTWEDSAVGAIASEDKVMELLTLMAKKNVELRQQGDETTDLFKKAYYYIIDEPAGEDLERARVCDLIVSRCKFAVADAYLKDYPDLYYSLISLSHVVTTPYADSMVGTDTVGGVQTWCPIFDRFHSEAQRQQYKDRQENSDRLGGEDVWWYGAYDPEVPFPTYHMDDELTGSRMLSWQQFDYDIDGNLYWQVNRFMEGMWEEAQVLGGAAGEGNLMYPGSPYGLNNPIATLRLESIREGLEDYEYLWMMEQAILQYNEEHGTDHDPETLMAWVYEGLYKGMTLVRGEHQQFYNRRGELLQALELLLKDPDAGIALLQSK